MPHSMVRLVIIPVGLYDLAAHKAATAVAGPLHDQLHRFITQLGHHSLPSPLTTFTVVPVMIRPLGMNYLRHVHSLVVSESHLGEFLLFALFAKPFQGCIVVPPVTDEGS